MLVRTGVFAVIVGDSTATVRGFVGRGHEPWPDKRATPDASTYRLYGFADAVAWRLTRELGALGLEWLAAAEAVRLEDAGQKALSAPENARRMYLCVASLDSVAKTGRGVRKTRSFCGTAEEVARAIETRAVADNDSDDVFSGLARARLVSMHKAVLDARHLAREAGYDIAGDGGFLPIGN